MKSRGYIDGDERFIIELFSRVYKRQLKEAFWRWRYTSCPFGKGIIRLMFDNDLLVGHYAVIPSRLWVGNEYCRGAFSMTTMTHPDYEGRGIFTTLARETYETCTKKGIEAIYGFPNANSYYGFTNKLGWKGFGNVEGWSLAGDAESIHEMDIKATRLAFFGKEHDGFWSMAKPSGRVMVPKTSDYMNWRYFDKPENEYQVFEFRDSEGTICGYTVLKIYRADRYLVGHIVDMLFLPNQHAQSSGVAHAIMFFKDAGVKEITTWATDEDIAIRLSEAGFRKKQWPVYFGAKYLGKSSQETPLIYDYGRWTLTMGDSDVF